MVRWPALPRAPRSASSTAARMACDDSGAGRMPSVRANCRAASNTGNCGYDLRFDLAEFEQMAEQRRRAVIAQSAGMNSGRNEIVAQCVHLDQRRQLRRVAVIVGERSLGQAGTGGRLHCDDPRTLARQPVQHVRQREPAEIAAAAEAANHHLGLFSGLLHLQFGLLADHGLVQHHVVQHAAQRVIGVVVRGRILHCLADGDPQAARRIGRCRQHAAAGVRMFARARKDFGAPGMHHHAAVGLLIVADAHHVHRAFEPKELARERERAAPLPGARFRWPAA